MRTALTLTICALAALIVAGCAAESAQTGDVEGRTVRVTATTNFITDLAREVGGDRVEVTGLMGPGVDPHLYKASAGDVASLREADLILYGGLELEGRMTDLLDELGETRPTVAVTREMTKLLAWPGPLPGSESSGSASSRSAESLSDASGSCNV